MDEFPYKTDEDGPTVTIYPCTLVAKNRTNSLWKIRFKERTDKGKIVSKDKWLKQPQIKWYTIDQVNEVGEVAYED